jgi:hypothetical protein
MNRYFFLYFVDFREQNFMLLLRYRGGEEKNFFLYFFRGGGKKFFFELFQPYKVLKFEIECLFSSVRDILPPAIDRRSIDRHGQLTAGCLTAIYPFPSGGMNF